MREAAGPPTRETRQLLLRAATDADVEALFAIQGDADAMRFTYCAPHREATRAFLESYAARFAEDGYAPWLALLRADGRVVGWGGLHRDPKEPHWGTEVAYFVARACWGRGLAGEIVAASLALAFGELGLAEVGAFTRPANRASARVLVRAGFERVGYEPRLERDRYLLRAPRNNP